MVRRIKQVLPLIWRNFREIDRNTIVVVAASCMILKSNMIELSTDENVIIYYVYYLEFRNDKIYNNSQ